MLHLFIIGVQNLVVETDMRYIKEMLVHPDIQSSASINQWILAILTFQFTLVHVKEKTHAPDGLLRQPQQPKDDISDEDDGFDDWINTLYGFLHMIQPFPQNSSKTLLKHTNLILIFAIAQISNGEEKININDSYKVVPRSAAAEADDFLHFTS